MSVVLAILVFTAALLIEFCATRYIQKVQEDARLSAVLWGLGQWTSATFIFVMAVKVSLWYLPLEALGIALGTWFALRGSSAKVKQ